jgi:hypothetical protein
MVARLLAAVVAVLLIVGLFVLLTQQRAINDASRQALVAQSLLGMRTALWRHWKRG